MNSFSGLINLQLMMFLLMGVGAAFRRRGIITDGGKKTLTDLIVYLILPCSIINSFTIDFDSEILKAGLTIFLISLGIQAVCAVVSRYCYNRIPHDKRVIIQYGTVCSNAGFLGNPLAEGVYGSMGLLYAAIYCIPQRIVMWSAGISYFTVTPRKRDLFVKVATHPCVFSCFIGIVILLTGYRFPDVIGNAIHTVGGCITTMTMLFIGAELADAGMRDILSGWVLLYTAIRLLIIPAIVMLVCKCLPLDHLASCVAVILAAMPMGTTTAILAAKYHGDEGFATQCIFVTTILSMVLLPAWAMLLEIVL